jgi:hypothetical protein
MGGAESYRIGSISVGEVGRAVEVVREAEAPLAAWQVFATAAELHMWRNREAEAARAWGASAAVLRKQADSMDEGNEARWYFPDTSRSFGY